MVHIWTDALGNIGLGGFILDDPPTLTNAKEAFSIPLSIRWKSKDIQFKEMMAILIALRHWRAQLAGSRVYFYCDNQAVVAGVAHKSIRGQVMGLLRDIVLLLALSDIVLQIIWIPTTENSLADTLSRRQFNYIADLFPQLNIALQTRP